MKRQNVLSAITAIIAVFVLSVTSVAPTYAIGGSGNQVGANATTSQQQRQQFRERACSNIQQTINLRLQTKTSKMSLFADRNTALTAKLNKLVENISAKYSTIDLSALRSDIAQLNTYYQNAVFASTAAYNAFGAVDFGKCLSGTGEFKTQLENARTLNKTAGDAHKSYWNFVKDSVRPDLQEIKAQIQALKPAI